nr:MAG TPA: RNA polymerase-like protein [Caudoviricetes sp.]
MTTIDYKKVKCPKCGKSYFRVKDNSGFTTLAFIIKPEPIYKNGKLQNPTEAEPIKVRCGCLECGCNFRVETHDVHGDYRFIDEDEERKENERRLAESFKVLKKETKEFETKIKPIVDSPLQLSKTIEIDKTPLTIKNYHEVVKEELDEIKERLSKLENKVLGENQ